MWGDQSRRVAFWGDSRVGDYILPDMTHRRPTETSNQVAGAPPTEGRQNLFFPPFTF